MTLSDFKREKEAYLAMKEELLKKYPGQFAAFYQGQLLAVDNDKSGLIKRVRKEHGNIPAFIQKIVEKEVTVRLPRNRRLSTPGG
ncbi:MAG: hypothetical protein ACE5IT_09635 [bacterium]